jgi:hypothetical protein
MMSDREELAHIIADIIGDQFHDDGYYCRADNLSEVCLDGYADLTDVADVIIAAGYAKPRVITTLEELDALPDGSVIQANNGLGGAAIREDRQWYMPNPFYKWEYDSNKVTLPAIVLFEPAEEDDE